MSITVSQSDFSDFEALQDVTQDARSEIVQIGRGQMSGTLTHLSFGPTFGISTGSFSVGIRTRGLMSPHRWMLGTLFGSKQSATTLNFNFAPGDIAIIKPGQERYSNFDDDTFFASTFVTPEALETFLVGQPGAVDLAVWRQPATVLTSDPATAASNIKQLSTVLAALVDHGPMLSAETADYYKRNILELMTAPLRNAARYQGTRLRSAQTLVREVDRYLRDAGTRPIHISELCEVFKVSRRTLHRAFHDVLGVPPISFLRHKRLGDVHSALLQGKPGLIRDIAREHGFLQHGKFAHEYERLFGEKPSKTLRRAHRGVHRVLWSLSIAASLSDP